jgi:hypothetical protein
VRNIAAIEGRCHARGEAHREAQQCAVEPSFLPRRSSWRRSAQGPPTSWYGGRKDSIRRRTLRKKVELVQPTQDEILDKAQVALEAGQPPDFLFSTLSERYVPQWAYEDRLADLERALSPVLNLFDADTVEVSRMLNGKTGRRGLYALPMGRIRITSMSGTASWSAPVSRSPAFRSSGMPSGLFGATRCSRRCVRP